MVDRAFAGRDFRLATGDTAARDRICRCAAALLDGRRLCAAALSWAAPGLLFDEHVERVRALGSRRVGQNVRQIARRRRGRRRSHRYDERRVCRVHFIRGAHSEWSLGDDGCALDGLESLAGHARFNLALISSDAHRHRPLAHRSLADGALSCFQATRETCRHRPGRCDDSGWALHDRRRRPNGALFLTRRSGPFSERTAG